MVYAGLPICSWWTFIKDKSRSTLTKGYALLENPVRFPEFQNSLLVLRVVDLVCQFLKQQSVSDPFSLLQRWNSLEISHSKKLKKTLNSILVVIGK